MSAVGKSRDPRHRLTEGVNRTRLRQEAKRSVRPLYVILAGLVVTVLGAGYLISNLSETLFRGTHEVRFALSATGGLTESVHDIRFKGIRAGKVSDVRRTADGFIAEGEITDRYGEVFENARAEVRPATPLEDMYIDIVDPGTPAAGKLGSAALASARTTLPVDIDDVLGVFRATERQRLRTVLDSLGNGLEDRGAALRHALDTAAPLLDAAGDLTAVMRERSTITKRLVANVGLITTELGERDTQLRTLVRDGAATLGTLQAGSADLDATLREIPPTFASINSSFTALRGVLGDVDTAVRDLYPVADRLPASLDDVRDLGNGLLPAMRALRAPVSDLVPLGRTLPPVTRNLAAAVGALRPQIPVIDKVTTSLHACQKGFNNFFQWNTSLTKFGDLRGPVPRGTFAFGVQDSGLAETKRKPGKNCDNGITIDGRLPTPEDEK